MFLLDIVMETLAGLEIYKQMKESPSAEVRRRVLVSKWLYVQGFFNDEFPVKTRFIPGHMVNAMGGDDNDDDE